MTRSPLPLLLVLSLLGAALPAHAQTAAQADALFKEGKRLMGAKQFAEACSAFEASYKLDPAITTLVNHADCREKNTQYASAWGLFLEVDRQTRGDKKHAALNRTARDRAATLEPRLSYLIINVPDDSRVDGLSITQNGQPVDALTWNRALPVDGGEYIIEGKAPGHEPWQTRVTVGPELDKQSVDVPKFKSVPTPEPVAGGAGADTGAAGGEDADVLPPPPTGMTGKRKAALGVGAAGVVSLIAAAVFELGARSKYDEAGTAVDDALQNELYEQAQGKRSAAVVFGTLGVASVGVATYLWLTGGRAATESDEAQAVRVVPAAGAHTLGVALTGSF